MSSTSGGGVPAVHGAPPAPIGRRVTASLVDGVLTALASAPLWAATVPAAVASVGQDTPPAAPPGGLLVAGAVLLLAWGVVQWVCHGTRGWTVGRRLLGLRTVDVRSARPLGLGRALVRSLVIALGALACGIGQLLVLLSPLFDGTGRHRGWHDRVADAVVVDVRGLPAARRVAAWEPVRRPATEPVVAREVPWAALESPDGGSGAATTADPGAGDPGAGHPLDVTHPPQPDAPARTRWAALAGERQLDAPGLVLPPLGRPGPGPDLDTRQMPTVPAAGPVPAGPGVPAWPGVADGPGVPDGAARTGRHAVTTTPADVGPTRTQASVPTPPHPDATPAPGGPHAPLPPSSPVWAVPAAPQPPASSVPVVPQAPTVGGPQAPTVGGPQASTVPPVPPVASDAPPGSPVPPASVVPPVPPGSAVPPVPPASAVPSAPARPGPAVPSLPEPPLPPLPPEPFPAAAPSSGPDGARSWAVRLPDGTVVGLEVPLLVGRNPEPQPGVRVAPVSDPGRSVSKTHLMLGSDDHGAWVVDRGSTNGTLVTLADGQRIVCLPDRRVRLTDGSLVAFGDLSLSVGLRA